MLSVAVQQEPRHSKKGPSLHCWFGEDAEVRYGEDMFGAGHCLPSVPRPNLEMPRRDASTGCDRGAQGFKDTGPRGLEADTETRGRHLDGKSVMSCIDSFFCCCHNYHYHVILIIIIKTFVSIIYHIVIIFVPQVFIHRFYEVIFLLISLVNKFLLCKLYMIYTCLSLLAMDPFFYDC